MNVLVYNGPGSFPHSVQKCLSCLRDFLEPFYAVSTISLDGLTMEPWTSKTAALVFPGGKNDSYSKYCKGVAHKINRYVKNGGIYIGICGGGYFASSKVEFDKNGPVEVIDKVNLKLFAGIARGPAYEGMQQECNGGGRVVTINSCKEIGLTFNAYYSGGPGFVNSHKYKEVEVLATYEKQLFAEGGPMAAVLLCSVGKGKTLLIGPHLERDVENINMNDPSKKCSKNRYSFMEIILNKAGLRCNSKFSDSEPLFPTPLFLCTTRSPDLLKKFVSSSNDKNGSKFEFTSGFAIKDYEAAALRLKNADSGSSMAQILVGSKERSLPPFSLTPNFNISEYFENLNPDVSMGSILMYGDIVTSTSTLLNGNMSFLESVPDNTVIFVASLQLNAKGRGNNSWVSPRGLLASTVCLSLPIISPVTNQPVSIGFIQYMSMIACCEAILSYGPGYEDIPIKIKWPNDMYALKPEYYYKNKIKLVGRGFATNPAPNPDLGSTYFKISGILVNIHPSEGKYRILVGCGLNIFNEAPTTSIKVLVDILNEERAVLGLHKLVDLRQEKLLAIYVNKLDQIVLDFMKYGSMAILPRYYKLWLHNNQIIELNEHDGVRAKITGISSDDGLLVAKQLKPGSDNECSSIKYTLQPDGNTFDMFRGLISKKA